jgi:hypothetical protein
VQPNRSNGLSAETTTAQANVHEVLVGASHPVPVENCAQRLMTRAGLTCLLETNNAFRGDPGTPIEVSLNPITHEVTTAGTVPAHASFIVAEQPRGGPTRGFAFSSLAGAAAHFGVKLVLQDAGTFSVEQGNPAAPPQKIVFTSTGSSDLSSIVMTALAA